MPQIMDTHLCETVLSTAPQKQVSEFPFVIPAQAGIQGVTLMKLHKVSFSFKPSPWTGRPRWIPAGNMPE
jgi:hypothetical protein